MQNQTLGEIAAQKIMEFIQEKGYSAGDKLPNEYELSSQLGVSRNTVREAVRALASRNVVVIKQGAGTFISEKKGVADDPLGFSMVENKHKLAQDLLQIRCIIEPPIAALAAQNAELEEIQALEALCREIEAAIRAGEDFMEMDIAFHTQIANCSKNIVISNLIPVINTAISVYFSVNEQEFIQTIKSHQQIFEAIRSHRCQDAQQAMLFHLLYNQNRMLPG